MRAAVSEHHDDGVLRCKLHGGEVPAAKAASKANTKIVPEAHAQDEEEVTGDLQEAAIRDTKKTAGDVLVSHGHRAPGYNIRLSGGLVTM
jgi:hypothetical protein